MMSWGGTSCTKPVLWGPVLLAHTRERVDPMLVSEALAEAGERSRPPRAGRGEEKQASQGWLEAAGKKCSLTLAAGQGLLRVGASFCILI